jgi:hypothetical protein
MKIELESKELIRCTPENKTELKDLLYILRIESMLSEEEINPEYFAALKGEITVFEKRAHRSSLEGGGGFVRSTVTTDYLQPYQELMKSRYGSGLTDGDLTPAMHIATHTHFVEKFWVEAGVPYFTSVFELFNWQGKVFATQEEADAKAVLDSQYHLENILGIYHHIPEFLELGNGLFKHNPAYGRCIASYDPGVHNEKVWALLSELWLERCGTPGQKAILERYSYVSEPRSAAKSWACIRDCSGFHVDGYTKSVTWEEFKKL